MDKLLTNLSHLMNHREQAGAEGFAELMGKIVGQDMGWETWPRPAGAWYLSAEPVVVGRAGAGHVSAAGRTTAVEGGWMDHRRRHSPARLGDVF